MDQQVKKDFIKTLTFEVPKAEVKTEVTLTLFSNQLMVVISQLNKFGSIIIGRSENSGQSFDPEDNIYEIKTIFGSREFEIYEIYARSILDIMHDNEHFAEQLKKKYGITQQVGNPFYGKSLTLFISLQNKNESIITFKEIIKVIKDNLVNLF